MDKYVNYFNFLPHLLSLPSPSPLHNLLADLLRLLVVSACDALSAALVGLVAHEGAVAGAPLLPADALRAGVHVHAVAGVEEGAEVAGRDVGVVLAGRGLVASLHT